MSFIIVNNSNHTNKNDKRIKTTKETKLYNKKTVLEPFFITPQLQLY